MERLSNLALSDEETSVVNVELGSNSRVRPFTKDDFGINTIDSLIARIEQL